MSERLECYLESKVRRQKMGKGNKPEAISLKIAELLAHASPGEKSEARNMSDFGSPFFWRITAHFGIQEYEEDKWLNITKAIAILTPSRNTNSIHSKSRFFGTVLADGGLEYDNLDKPFFSELRLSRLLNAPQKQRFIHLERAVRMLARKQPSIHIPSLAFAYIKKDIHYVAKDYYRRLCQSELELIKKKEEANA